MTGYELAGFTKPEPLAQYLQQHQTEAPVEVAYQGLVFTNFGEGVLEFADVAFPGLDRSRIYAEKRVREPGGQGPHFDVYEDGIDQAYPWVAVYNLAGRASVRATLLPEVYAKDYTENFPERDAAAYDARRHYSELAFSRPGAKVSTGTLEPNMGMIVLQKPTIAPVVHEIIPRDPDNPGEFVKLICPADNEAGREIIEKTGSVPLDTFVTNALRAAQRSSDLPAMVERARRPGRGSASGRPRTPRGMID